MDGNCMCGNGACGRMGKNRRFLLNGRKCEEGNRFLSFGYPAEI